MSNSFTFPNGPLPWHSVPHDFSGDNILGMYATETTQRYVYGTRFLAWDGRVMKYGNSYGALKSYHGCRASEAAALAITAAPVASVVGDRSITATLASRSEDDLAGGYAVIYDGGDIDTTCQRGIVGNDATSGTTTKIYLDSPLAAPVVATTDSLEIFNNPYRRLLHTADGYSAWVGVPCVSTTAAADKLWIQTWGPCLISGGETIDSPSSDARTLVWGSNYSLYKTATKTSGQIAGYILNQGSSSIAGPMIMLMCST